MRFGISRRLRRRWHGGLLPRRRGGGGSSPGCRWLTALLSLFLLLRIARLGGELSLTLAEHLHQLTPRLFVFGAVHRRAVVSFAETSQRDGKAHRLLLDFHGGDDHLLALAHAVEQLLRQLKLHLAAGGEADRVWQLNRLLVIDLDLHACRNNERIGGRHPEQKLLLLLTL